MISEIKYAILGDPIEEASEIYFWQNAVSISPKFIDGFIEHQTKWIDKRVKPFGDGNYEAGTLVFGTSVLKNKPVVMMTIRK